MLNLTSKEKEVLHALYELDCNTDSMTDALGITRATLRSHLNSLYDKTGARSKAALVLKAVRLGLVGDMEAETRYRRRMGDFLRDIPNKGQAVVLPSGLYKLEARDELGILREVRRGNLLTEVDYV